MHHHPTNALPALQSNIQELFSQRHQLIEDIKFGLANPEARDGEVWIQNMSQKIQKYTEIARQIKRTQTHNNNQQDSSYDQFWKLNEQKEKNIERKLRELKDNDQLIASISIKQQKLWELAEQIQQQRQNSGQGRQMQVSQRSENQKVYAELQKYEKQKQKHKQSKLSTIVELLQELNQLKQIRQQRLSQFAEQKITSLSISILTDLIKDLKQVVEQRQIVQQHHPEDQLLKNIQILDTKVKQSQQQLLQLYEQYSKHLEQLRNLTASKQTSFKSQHNLLNILQIQPADLSNFLGQSASFISRQRKIKQENDQLKQGVAITAQTMQIFQRVKVQIQTETHRKVILTNLFQSIQVKCLDKVSSEAELIQSSKQLEKLKLNRSKLQSKLTANAKELDKNVQKLLTEQLQEYDADINAKTAVVVRLKSELNSFLLQIADELKNAFSQCGDIIIDTIPDFQDQNQASKEAPIHQLLAKLSKILKRLSANK